MKQHALVEPGATGEGDGRNHQRGMGAINPAVLGWGRTPFAPSSRRANRATREPADSTAPGLSFGALAEPEPVTIDVDAPTIRSGSNQDAPGRDSKPRQRRAQAVE